MIRYSTIFIHPFMQISLFARTSIETRISYTSLSRNLPKIIHVRFKNTYQIYRHVYDVIIERVWIGNWVY
jgi:hypothetical protein